MKAPRSVVLDVDDTLYLERDYVRSGSRAVGRYLELNRGVSGFEEAAWSAFESGIRGRIFDHAVAQLGVTPGDESLIPRLVDEYRTHRPEIELAPDALRAITALYGRARLAVITDGPVESQQAKVLALGLSAWCDPVILTATLGPGAGKPSPRAFELVEREHGSHGRECVYLADNPAKDFAGPRSLGWRTVRVRRLGGLHFNVESGDDVDLEVNDLENLPELLGF